MYLSAMGHNSFDKIAKNIGLAALRKIPVTADCKLDAEALERQIDLARSAGR